MGLYIKKEAFQNLEICSRSKPGEFKTTTYYPIREDFKITITKILDKRTILPSLLKVSLQEIALT